MASRDHDEDKSFISRWSQRKRAAEAETAHKEDAPREETGRPPQTADADAAQGAVVQGGAGEGESGKIDPSDLPDIDSLEAESDFTPFLQKGVPDALRRRALRKLWRLDPVFGHLDGLNDYDLDYTNAGTIVEGMKTVYQVGKGMVLGNEEEADKTAQGDGDEAPAVEKGSAEEGLPPEEAPQEELEAQTAALEEQAGDTGAVLPPAAPQRETKARNPGDPIVSGAPTRRSNVTRAPRRSALQRRWGDPERD